MASGFFTRQDAVHVEDYPGKGCHFRMSEKDFIPCPL